MRTLTEEIGVCSINRFERRMTVTGKIGVTKVNFLVDTGARCTIISEKMYRELCRDENYQLGVLTGRKLQLADGAPMPVLGLLNGLVQLGSVAVMHEIVVAGISEEGIIGYDFLKIHGCIIDIVRDELQLKGRKVPLNAPEGNRLEESVEQNNAVFNQDRTETLETECSTIHQVQKIREVEVIPGLEQVKGVTLNGKFKELIIQL